MNNTLKSVGNIGAELAAAKAQFQLEMERHRKTWRQLEQVRGLLREALDELVTMKTEIGFRGNTIAVIDRIDTALSQQAEPRCEYCDGTGSRLTTNFDGFPVLKPCPCVQQAEPVEPAPAQGERDSLAERMRAAGMLTIDEMISGAPLDRFIRHAGVNDLDTYGQWLEMKCREFLSMKASRELEKREDDDLYEWVLAHAAAFQEARINFNAARPAQTEQQPVAAVPEAAAKVINALIAAKLSLSVYRNVAPEIHALCDLVENNDLKAMLAAPIAQTAPQPEQSRLSLLKMIDAAMVEMRNISPPLRRSDCERLIRAALSAQG